MTRWLASVQSLEEAQSLVEHLPDILDMKNPSQGALGALTHQTVTDIVRWVNHRCLCSATVGDLTMQADILSAAISAMAETGVDYVKIGIFDEPDLSRCIEQLESTIKAIKAPIIAVMFADQLPSQSVVPTLAKAGFAGVMLDTATKNGQGLLDHLSIQALEKFVFEAKSARLICGLAGALKIENIQNLRPLDADYLGFRSALCHQQTRTSFLEPKLAKQIQNQMNAGMPKAKAG